MSFISVAPYAAERIDRTSAELLFLESICIGDSEKSAFPENYCVRAETIIDDGLQCVVEWTLTVSPKGYAAGRVPQSGVAVYERDRNSGLLRSIRICDNVGKEDDIFLEELPEEVRPFVTAYRKDNRFL